MSDVMVAVIALALTCGYVVVAGLVHVVASESPKFDEVEAWLAAAFWPAVPPIAVVTLLLKILLLHIPRAIVDSVRRTLRERADGRRMPRAEVRRARDA